MIKPNSTVLLRRKNEVDEMLIKIFDKDLKTAINNLKVFGQKKQHFSNDAFQSYYDLFKVN